MEILLFDWPGDELPVRLADDFIIGGGLVPQIYYHRQTREVSILKLFHYKFSSL
jgi:hypothetical protein